MALLTTGDWYMITFLNTNDAAWAALGVRPAIPNLLIDYIVDGTPFMMRVLDSGTGMFAFAGGIVVGFDDTLINTQVGPLTKNTWTDDNSVSYEYGIDTGSLVWYYNSSTGTISRFSAPESTAMKAFLP